MTDLNITVSDSITVVDVSLPAFFLILSVIDASSISELITMKDQAFSFISVGEDITIDDLGGPIVGIDIPFPSSPNFGEHFGIILWGG